MKGDPLLQKSQRLQPLARPFRAQFALASGCTSANFRSSKLGTTAPLGGLLPSLLAKSSNTLPLPQLVDRNTAFFVPIAFHSACFAAMAGYALSNASILARMKDSPLARFQPIASDQNNSRPIYRTILLREPK
jgi:hypothetical protein